MKNRKEIEDGQMYLFEDLPELFIDDSEDLYSEENDKLINIELTSPAKNWEDCSEIWLSTKRERRSIVAGDLYDLLDKIINKNSIKRGGRYKHKSIKDYLKKEFGIRIIIFNDEPYKLYIFEDNGRTLF